MAAMVGRVALVVVSVTVVQRGVLPHLRVADVVPDLLLLVALVGGLVGGAQRGAVIGFVAGLATDLLLAGPFGLTALVWCLAGYLAGWSEYSAVRSSRWRPVLTAGLGSALAYGALVLVGLVLGQRGMVDDDLVRTILVVSVVNAALSPLAVRVMRWALGTEDRIRYPAVR